MKAYFIRTEATEDKPAMTCVYLFKQWKELISDFKEQGIQFSAWSEYVFNIGDMDL